MSFICCALDMGELSNIHCLYCHKATGNLYVFIQTEYKSKSVGPDHTALKEQYDLGLHCLLISF